MFLYFWVFFLVWFCVRFNAWIRGHVLCMLLIHCIKGLAFRYINKNSQRELPSLNKGFFNLVCLQFVCWSQKLNPDDQITLHLSHHVKVRMHQKALSLPERIFDLSSKLNGVSSGSFSSSFGEREQEKILLMVGWIYENQITNSPVFWERAFVYRKICPDWAQMRSNRACCITCLRVDDWWGEEIFFTSLAWRYSVIILTFIICTIITI